MVLAECGDLKRLPPMHTDKKTIEDTMDFIWDMELNNMQLNDERNETEKNIVNQKPIAKLSVSSVFIGGNL